jgi:hypothetical protein
MALNRIFVGYPFDLNIGNGKTSSAVGAVLNLWANDPERTIFSNIKLFDIDYQLFTPENIPEVLETKNAIVILDELHAIVHKNHRISESCGKHSIKGLCYHLSEFFRQVRKRRIDTYTTCQTLEDCQFQYRQLMNTQTYCQLGHKENGRWVKCEPMKYPQQECPSWHQHWVKQKTYPSAKPWQSHYFNIQPYYNYYDSFEIVKSWIPSE